MGYQFQESIQKGILLLAKTDKDFLLQVLPIIKSDYFEFPSHTKIYEVITNYFDKYNILPNDPIILEEIKKTLKGNDNISDYEDELAYINKIITAPENKDYYLDLVEKFARQEAMKRAIASSIVEIKVGNFDNVENLIRQALLISRNINIGHTYFDQANNRWKKLFNDAEKDKFKTLFPSLDSCLDGGLNRKELALYAGLLGSGKSIFLINTAVQLMTDGRKVLYISLEMSEEKIAQRVDSIMTMIPQAKLKDNILEVEKRLKLFKDTFPNGELIIKEYPTVRANVNNIRALLSQLYTHTGFKPDVIIVDYLELLRPTNEGDAEYLAQERIAQELRGLAVEYNLLVWSATQVNRQGTKVNIITDAELADSYGKARTPDLMLSLNQKTDELAQGKMRTYVLKNRNGKHGWIIPTSINYETLIVKELPKPTEIEEAEEKVEEQLNDQPSQS